MERELSPKNPGKGLRDHAFALAQLFVLPRSPLDYLRGSALPSGGHRVRVTATRHECDGTTTLTLSPAPASWLAGQHVDLSVLIDGAFHTRTFSISSAPPAVSTPRGARARTFDVTIRAAAHGRVTPMLVANAKPGDELRVSAPKGDFVLPEAGTEPLLLVTAGSGITPVMSMLRAAREGDTLGTRDIVHVHFERSAERVVFAEELLALAQAHPTYQRTVVLTGDDVDLPSMLARLRAACPDLALRQTFACGPAPLLDGMRAFYKDEGITDRLFTESFGTALAPASNGSGGRLTFTRSNVHVDADGRTSLLLLAERAGLKPTHGCRRGLCHSCEATLVKGTVRDLRTGMTTVATGARVQLCISAAVTDVEVAL